MLVWDGVVNVFVVSGRGRSVRVCSNMRVKRRVVILGHEQSGVQEGEFRA